MIPGRHFAALQIQGARPYQEDHFGCVNDLKPTDPQPSHLLLVLADGMGGHNGGAHASRVAVDCFMQTYMTTIGGVSQRLEQALAASNERIRVDAEADSALNGMGCTLVGVAFLEDGVVWISVGDSPFWRYREGIVKKLNADHSMAPILALQVQNGHLTAEEAARHPARNALRSALTGEPIPHTDLRETPIRLRDGDKFVLASDGLETLTEAEIAAVMKQDLDALDLARELVKAVESKQRRGQDNTTVMVVTPYRKGDTTPIVDWTP